jgi:hypothetical protein
MAPPNNLLETILILVKELTVMLRMVTLKMDFHTFLGACCL